jgi:hypothetical protein
MRMRRRLLLGLLSLMIALSGAAFTRDSAPAADLNPPPGPDRFSVDTINYTAYQWYMRAWSGRVTTCNFGVNHLGFPYKWEVFNNCGEYITEDYLHQVACSSTADHDTQCWQGWKAIACKLEVDHEGMPLPEEVYRDCGEDIYNTWVVQPPCVVPEKDLSLLPAKDWNKNSCEGYYVHLISKQEKQKQVPHQLAQATAWLSLEDCQPVRSTSTNICETQPTLVVRGEEPLADKGYSITRVEGTYDDQDFSCDKDVCKFHLQETGDEGVPVTFWAYSTYGDSSVVLTAQVRVKKADEGDPDQMYWYVDVLSSQWKGEVSATCSDMWGVFPPVGGVPDWLTTPTDSAELSSGIPYTYLSANLIMQGLVDARACPDGGIVPGGVANQCGLEKARPVVNQWQNQFDSLIITVALDTSVPARLLKNLFARESQFWPGVFPSKEDVGLGQLTENGADTTLYWNEDFYQDFCPRFLPAAVCGKGYMHLTEENQIILRRALVNSVNATCTTCPLGLDLTQADFSVGVFAHTMTANCGQAAQVIYNYTGQEVSEVADYEDLWKFTLVNYNAGGGCLASAVSNAYVRGQDITWDNVSQYLTGACSGSVDYVNDISK